MCSLPFEKRYQALIESSKQHPFIVSFSGSELTRGGETARGEKEQIKNRRIEWEWESVEGWINWQATDSSY
jgi:hypothetical protein